MSKVTTSSFLKSASMSGLFSLAPAAIGCGVGVLIADKLRKKKQTTAITLFSVAAASAIPVIVTYVIAKISGPDSRHGSRKRLRSIREDRGWGDWDSESE